ncbi:maltase A2-like [Planococcus citri]|uniref:maltase A2-like n=1 Tax=Planococcus citri TaxID=170843 RepID=UPI0031F99998
MRLFLIPIFLLFVSRAFTFDRNWWKHASIYQVYLRSFKDNDGDGIGDFNGLISKLDYLAEIGVNTIYVSPFYPSPMVDFGYDISDYKEVDPVYGTMKDFEQLIREMKSRKLHLVIDLVINHSSDKHIWFEKSVNKIDPYTDYYIWVDPKGYDQNGFPIPPNNWFSVFSFGKYGSAWQWNEKRQQFYMHHFTVQQPDLNLRNNAVKEEVKEIMKFWLEKGVAGFRVDAPPFFMEDKLLRDNPLLNPGEVGTSAWLKCKYNLDQPDTITYLNELNAFLKEYDRKSGKQIQTPLLGETLGPVRMVMKYFGTRRFPAFHMPLNYLLRNMETYFNARELHDFLHTWLDQLPKNKASSWALGDHDVGRYAHRFSAEYNYIMLALVTMLPGTCLVYYGVELNMNQNNLVRINDLGSGSENRFSHRSPMHWDNSRNAGFSSGEKTWLSVNPNYWNINVQNQRTYENSSLNYFKDLMALRKTNAIKYGNLRFHIMSDWVLAFTRTHKKTSYIVIMNLGTDTLPIDWLDEIDYLPGNLTVVASSSNSAYKKGFKMNITKSYPSSLLLRPNSVIILSSV